ncbi:hypothetical protein Cni_G07815 [Canna indica]|uniref:Phospholipase A2 family protein n=1 Tax=Canna indica TaxID=4628 RepID=A0AAQ3K0Z2_9LILI|nr:hypothetical protein Cni_G07815 [Canna indica]
MGRRATWSLPSSFNLPFSTNLFSSLTTLLPTASISSLSHPTLHSHPVASLPPFPPPPQLQSEVSFPQSLVDSLTRSLRSILPSRPAAAPARRAVSRPRPRPEAGCALPLFRPYVATVPWHGGARAFLSQLFPRYGHYCGPNWSSGKDGGSMLWDRRPVDWLDFCCYCHDIGYDTHDQAKLLKSDLAFLDCLEKPRMATKGGSVWAASLYRAMCIAGLRNILIPYRMHLVRLQSEPSFMEVCNNFISKVTSSSKIEGEKRKYML